MLINNFEGSVILRWSAWLFEESWDSQKPPKYLSPHHLGRCNSHTKILLVIVWGWTFSSRYFMWFNKKHHFEGSKIHLILQESLCILTKLHPPNREKTWNNTQHCIPKASYWEVHCAGNSEIFFSDCSKIPCTINIAHQTHRSKKSCWSWHLKRCKLLHHQLFLWVTLWPTASLSWIYKWLLRDILYICRFDTQARKDWIIHSSSTWINLRGNYVLKRIPTVDELRNPIRPTTGWM